MWGREDDWKGEKNPGRGEGQWCPESENGGQSGGGAYRRFSKDTWGVLIEGFGGPAQAHLRGEKSKKVELAKERTNQRSPTNRDDKKKEPKHHNLEGGRAKMKRGGKKRA